MTLLLPYLRFVLAQAPKVLLHLAGTPAGMLPLHTQASQIHRELRTHSLNKKQEL